MRYAKSGRLSDVVFRPATQEIDATYEGRTIAVNYPTDRSLVQFQDVLEQHHIRFDSIGTAETCTGGASTIEAVLILLALALLLIAPIVTAIYLGRRLNKEKRALAAAI